MNYKIPQKIVVHGGVFHADDVMCVAMAKILNPEVKVERDSRPSEQDIADEGRTGIYVANVGKGKFDHHQTDCAIREDNGEKHAACGLLFDVWKDQLFPNEKSEKIFEQNYIIPIEITDNGGERNPFSQMVSAQTPTWDSKESMDDAFFRTVDTIQLVVEKEIENAVSKEKAKNIVQEKIQEAEKEHHGIVVLDTFVPWQSEVIPSDNKFVMYPSIRTEGHWNLQVVPASETTRGAKQDLPAEWRDGEKPEGLCFVHNGLFISEFDTKEHALNAISKELEIEVPEKENKIDNKDRNDDLEL
jgi:uncharacterized UPF0160 family protein